MSVATITRRATSPPALPVPRGPVSAHLVEQLVAPPHELDPAPAAVDDPICGDDGALALYLCYELHYRGFAGVDPAWEWEPSLLRERGRLEAAFVRALQEQVQRPVGRVDVRAELDALTRSEGPSLSAHLERTGTLDQLQEFAIHRSAYQLKEADPHTWAIPRLDGRAKAALVHIQAGEYGDGDHAALHATLFATTMRALGLDDRYGHYLDRIPGPTLATVNLVSFFGLHRRWRGALVGHLALFEMCSVVPMGRYARALRRLGVGEDAARFYDVHVLADTHHQVVARDDLAGGLADADPDLAGDIVFGARAVDALEAGFARHLLGSWSAGRSSLVPVPRA